MRTTSLVLVLVPLATIAGCRKEDPVARAEREAMAEDFWPEAPSVVPAGKRMFVYQPQSFAGYKLDVDLATDPSSDVAMRGNMDVRFVFGPGSSPSERDARLTGLTLDIDAAGQRIAMKLDGQELVLTSAGETTRMKRGESGPFDVATLVDEPFTTLVVGAGNRVSFRSNPSHPFTMLGGDMLDTALVLFPDLPTTEIAAGHKWVVERDVSLGAGLGRADVTYRFTYAGDGTCPSGVATCARLDFDASSNEATVRSQGQEAKVRFAFAGKVYFDVTKGRVDESRVRMRMSAKVMSMTLTVGATYKLKPI
jgi:hypothetical protein